MRQIVVYPGADGQRKIRGANRTDLILSGFMLLLFNALLGILAGGLMPGPGFYDYGR